MEKIPTIGQLKQLVAHVQGVVFPDYYAQVAVPEGLDLPEAFWHELPSIAQLVNTDRSEEHTSELQSTTPAGSRMPSSA